MRLQALEQFLRLLQARKLLLRLAEIASVDPPARARMLNRMRQVQHLVEHHVIDRKRETGFIEDAADDNRVVRWVEMPEHGARPATAPAELRASHQPVEVLAVQPLENLFELVVLPLRPRDEFSAADLADQLRLPPHILTVQVKPVAVVVRSRDRLTVEFAEQ